MSARQKTYLLKFLAGAACLLCSHAYAVPFIVNVGAEESLPGPGGRLPHIATDMKNQPHVVADEGGAGRIYTYHKILGIWQWAQYDFPGGSAQAYNPHIEINEFNQAWISCVRWYSEAMRVVLLGNVDSNPQELGRFPTTGGMPPGSLPVSNLSIDPKRFGYAVVYGGNGGFFDEVSWGGANFTSFGTGSINVGPGGEKNYFWVSRAGNVQHNGRANQAVWHGCTDYSYNNSVRAFSGRGLVEWCKFEAYPAIGNDGAYPIVVSDTVEPQTAYLMHGYGTGIILNIWKGTTSAGDGFLVRPNTDLIVVAAGGTSGLRRFEPQLFPANGGGVWACYTENNNIHIRYIPSTATSSSDLGPVTQFPGVLGAIAVDSSGNLHVTYLNGSRKYRKLTVFGDGSTFSDDGMSVFAPAFTGRKVKDEMLLFIPSFTRQNILDPD